MDHVGHLIRAAAANDLQTLQSLLRAGTHPDGRDEDGWSALLAAAVVGSLEVVRALLDAGADVNGRGPDGSTPLMKATLWRRADIVRLLVERGADARTVDDRGWTALEIAKTVGHREVLEQLEPIMWDQGRSEAKARRLWEQR